MNGERGTLTRRRVVTLGATAVGVVTAGCGVPGEGGEEGEEDGEGGGEDGGEGGSGEGGEEGSLGRTEGR